MYLLGTVNRLGGRCILWEFDAVIQYGPRKGWGFITSTADIGV
jgi:hypothetical protein